MLTIVRCGLGLVAATTLVAACQSSSDSTPAGSSGESSSGAVDSGIPDARPLDAAAGTDAASADSGPVNTAYLACMDSAGHLSTSLKVCSGDGECTIQKEQTNCCGEILYVGVNQVSTGAFAACAAAWAAHFPACGCKSKTTLTEDGLSSDDAEAPRVRCDNGLCKTWTWRPKD